MVSLKRKYEVVNYIEVNGQTICLDDQPLEERLRYGRMIQDRMMGTLGYRRKTSEKDKSKLENLGDTAPFPGLAAGLGEPQQGHPYQPGGQAVFDTV